MRDERLKRTYAQVLLETATGDWLSQLKAVQNRLAKGNYSEVLDNPKTPFAQKEESIAQLLKPGAKPEVRNFLMVLAKENRFSRLGEIIAELEDMAVYGPQVKVVEVTSAVPLTLEEEETLKEKISRRFGGPLAYRFQVDPKILGGMVVRVGDKIIDGSLTGRLQALRERLRSS